MPKRQLSRIQSHKNGDGKISIGLLSVTHSVQITSLCQQLAFCHSVNSAADTPVHLELTSMGGVVGKTLKAQLSGVDNWPVTLTEGAYLETFKEHKQDLVSLLLIISKADPFPSSLYANLTVSQQRSCSTSFAQQCFFPRLLLYASEGGNAFLQVYLTADSQCTLTELDSKKAYIIGGLVDRNSHKGLCEGKAREQGISTAKLPIQDHVDLAGNKVLTVNQVFAMLVEWVVRFCLCLLSLASSLLSGYLLWMI